MALRDNLILYQICLLAGVHASRRWDQVKSSVHVAYPTATELDWSHTYDTLVLTAHVSKQDPLIWIGRPVNSLKGHPGRGSARKLTVLSWLRKMTQSHFKCQMFWQFLINSFNSGHH